MTEVKWAHKEFEMVDLGDERLNQRLIQLTERFFESPESPINTACGNWNETKAAYRFFQNENIDYQDILKSHAYATKERAKKEKIILAIQDTTYFNYSHHPKIQGLGTLNKYKGKNKDEILTSGLIMHSTLTCTTDGLPLGILDQKIYSREEVPIEKRMKSKSARNRALPIEEKESIRWLNSLRKTKEYLDDQGKAVVTIADHEADIYELFLLAENLKSKVLIRASHNRKVNKTSIHSEISGEKLWDLMGREKTKGKIKIRIPKSDTQAERLAICNVRFERIKVLPPKSYIKSKKKDKPKAVELYAISLKEQNSSSKKNRIDWMLLSNIPIITFSDAIEKIGWYCLRWRIETFHKILKSGLKVENCRLETADRLIRYLATMSIVAWRVFWVTLIARVSPTSTALLFLDDLEWKILFSKFCPNKKIPKKAPEIKQVVIWIAQLGGFLARKGDKDPGIIYIWRGLKKFANIMEGVQTARNIYG